MKAYEKPGKEDQGHKTVKTVVPFSITKTHGRNFSTQRFQ